MQPSQNKCFATGKCPNVSPDPNEAQLEHDRSVASALRLVPSSESTEPERGAASRRAAIKDRAGAAGSRRAVALSQASPISPLAHLLLSCPEPGKVEVAEGFHLSTQNIFISLCCCVRRWLKDSDRVSQGCWKSFVVFDLEFVEAKWLLSFFIIFSPGGVEMAACRWIQEGIPLFRHNMM